jgi:hypothetical protein
MSDIKLLNDQITGLKEKLKGLRTQKALFDKAKGIDEQIAKMQKDGESNREEARKTKAVFEKLMAKKNATVYEALETIMAKMNSVLPAGKTILEAHNGDCFIGWHNGNTHISYPGLSGGEKVAFDTALVYALGGNILITEAAELDDDRLTSTLAKYSLTDLQCIVLSAHEPASVPEGWEVVRL